MHNEVNAMIDILRAKRVFAAYVKAYDAENDKIKMKIEHIERVSQVAKKLATKLELEEEDVKLAELIGLLHDIGRFEQIKTFNTFNDRKSVNHGEYGVHVLFNKQNGMIRKFIEDNQYDDIIKNAIYYHNKDKLDIPDNLTTRELLHIKIVRDSDKIDILNILTYEKKETAWEKADLSDDVITEEIYNEFMENGRIDYHKRKTSADSLVGHFAYIFDFNFPESIQFIKQQNYMEKIYKRFEFHDSKTMEQYQKIYNKVVSYMKTIL